MKLQRYRIKSLYSYKLEIVTNASDTTRIANSETPVYVTLTNNELTIQDFGEGMSPEIIDTVFTNAFSSNNRNSKKATGSFGLGRMTSLAYTKQVTYVTNYNGIKYTYLLIKGSPPELLKLSEKKTKDINGTTVIIPIGQKDDLYEFKQAAKKHLGYFNNIKLNGFGVDINDYYLLEYDTFIFKTKNQPVNGLHIVIDNNFYSFDYEALGFDNVEYLNLPVALKFKINDLQITQNREQIRINDFNKDKIRKKLRLFYDELETLYEKNKTIYQSYLDLKRNTAISSNKLILKNDKIDKAHWYYFHIDNKPEYLYQPILKYQEEGLVTLGYPNILNHCFQIKRKLNIQSNILNKTNKNSKVLKYDSNKVYYRMYNIETVNKAKLKQIRLYLKDTFTQYAVFLLEQVEYRSINWKKLLYLNCDETKQEEIKKILYHSITKEFNDSIINIMDVVVPQDWIDKNKNKLTSRPRNNTKKSKDEILIRKCEAGYLESTTTAVNVESLKDIDRIYYTTYDCTHNKYKLKALSTYLYMFSFLKKDIRTITISPTNIKKYIMNMSNAVDIKNIEKDPLYHQLLSVYLCKYFMTSINHSFIGNKSIIEKCYPPILKIYNKIDIMSDLVRFQLYNLYGNNDYTSYSKVISVMQKYNINEDLMKNAFIIHLFLSEYPVFKLNLTIVESEMLVKHLSNIRNKEFADKIQILKSLSFKDILNKHVVQRKEDTELLIKYIIDEVNKIYNDR